MMRALGPDQYGTLMLVWSITGILAPLTDLGLSQLLLRQGARHPSWGPALLRYSVWLRVGTGVVVVGTIVAVSRLVDGPLSPVAIGVLTLSASAPLVDGFFLTATAISQTERRMPLLALWRTAGFVLLVFALWVLIPRISPMAASATAYSAASLLALLGFFATRSRSASSEGDASILLPDFLSLLKQARPFLFVGAASLAYGKIEVLLLATLLDPAAAGFYHAAYQVVLLVFSVSDILFTALLAKLYQTGADPRVLASYWPPICRVLCILAVLTLPPAWWYAGEIMTVIGGDPFAAAAPVLRALLPMVALLPAAAALNFLLLLDMPSARAAVDTGCLAATTLLVSAIAVISDVAMAALGASIAYALACLAGTFLTARAGLRLPWVVQLLQAWLIVTPSFLTWCISWPTWWTGAAAQLATAALLLYLLRFIQPSDLDTLAGETTAHERE